MDMIISGRNYRDRLNDFAARGTAEGETQQQRLDQVRAIVRQYRDEIERSQLDIPEGVLADSRPVTVDQGEVPGPTPEELCARALALIASWQATMSEGRMRVMGSAVES